MAASNCWWQSQWIRGLVGTNITAQNKKTAFVGSSERLCVKLHISAGARKFHVLLVIWH